MPTDPNWRSDAEKVADIVRDSGDRIVGRTRLQKIAYLFEITGIGDNFSFKYHNYGPYSDDISTAIHVAELLDFVHEDEKPATWGGFYSIYTANGDSSHESSEIRRRISAIAAEADPIQLELAASAAYLALEGDADPWEETARRKPEKASKGRLEQAKVLYGELAKVQTPERLPEIL